MSAPETSGARDRILAAAREALQGRTQVPHPGTSAWWRTDPPPVKAVDLFEEMFRSAGGEVVRLRSESAAAAWLADFAPAFRSAAVGRLVPDGLRPPLPAASPEGATLGVSMARSAIAETGTLILDSRDGRRVQLLPATHVVWVRAPDVFLTMREALMTVKTDLPSALGLHSGPSKSADIGQILVKGVHGPGRVVAGILS